MKLKINKKIAYLLLLLITAVLVATVRFEIIGLRTILGMIVVFIVPAYLLLGYFDLEDDERLFFSLFIGIGIIPLLVWTLNRVIYSLRLSLALTVAVLSIVGLYLKKIKKKNKEINTGNKVLI